jgi:uncharacterized protein
MYNHDDKTYLQQPKFVSFETIEKLVSEVESHCISNKIPRFTFIFHGGEPLLFPKNKFTQLLDKLESLKLKKIELNYALQTNGMLIDEEWCEILNKYNVGIGVSIDGPMEINDINRIDKRGKGTYERVLSGIDIAHKNLKNPIGLLSVINLNIDAIDAYNHIKSLEGKSVDFLMLDENHDSDISIVFTESYTPNADWYIKIFEKWFTEDDSTRVQIRFFEVIIHNILGGKYSIDSIGSGTNNVLVVETDGGMEAVDVLKICGEGFTKENLNINENSFDDAFNAPLAEIYYNSGKYLSKKCLACPVNEICGSGYLPHRYSSRNGFNNPSVYCDDLLKLITHIQNRVIDDLPPKLIEETGIEKITYEEALQMIEEKLPTIPEPDYAPKLESFRKLEYEMA